MRDTVSLNGTSYLTSDAFSTMGDSILLLSFDQVCKINFADLGTIDYSVNNGSSWLPLTAGMYSGTSEYFNAFNYFASFSYGSLWSAAYDTAAPQPTWWRSELFDLSSVARDYAQVRIRFTLTDFNGDGNTGNYGWLVDNVKVASLSTNPYSTFTSAHQPGTLNVYPNPATGIIYVDNPGGVNDHTRITITDVLGNETWSGTQDKSPRVVIDLSSHPNGIYFLQIKSERFTECRKIVLEK